MMMTILKMRLMIMTRIGMKEQLHHAAVVHHPGQEVHLPEVHLQEEAEAVEAMEEELLLQDLLAEEAVLQETVLREELTGNKEDVQFKSQ